jgi:hypothetical protein
MNTEAVCGLGEELLRVLEIHQNYLIKSYDELMLFLHELGYPTTTIDQVASLCRTLLDAGLLEHHEDSDAQKGLFRITNSANAVLNTVYATRR